MTLSKSLLASAAALALVACGDKGGDSNAPETKAATQAVKAGAKSPLDSDFKLKSAQEVAPETILGLLHDDNNDDDAPTYESAAFDSKIGATVFNNLRFADAEDGEAILIGRAEFFGVDSNAIDKIKDSSLAAFDAPFATAFEKVRLYDISAEGIDDDGASITIGAVEFDKLAIREGGVDKASEIDKGAQFFNAVSLGGLYVKDIAVAAGKDDTASVSFAAPDLRLVGFGGGKLEAIIANGLTVSQSQSAESIAAMSEAMGPQAGMIFKGPLRSLIAPDSQETTIDTLEWRKIDFSGALEWALKDEKPPASARDLIDLGTMKAADMETLIGGKRLAYIEEATISEAEFTWLVPSKIRADTKGAVYDLTAYAPDTEDPVYDIIKSNGLDNVKGDGSMEWNWNDKSGAANLDYITTTDGFMDFTMDLDLSDLKLAEMAAEREEGEKPVFGALKSFSLELKDEKALDVVFAIAALQMGGSGADLRQSAPAMIRLSGAQMAQMNPRFTDYINAFADFVAKSGRLKITAAPEDPLAFSTLQSGAVNPMALPETLNLQVTHSE